MLLGYNTNGFSSHQLGDAFSILHEIGYRSIAVTLERDLLDPPDRGGVSRCIDRLKTLIDAHPMQVTIETGSRFILDPKRKHFPTLLSSSPSDRNRRTEFLCAAIDVAAAVHADSVSLWSGNPDDEASADELMARLTGALGDVLQHATANNVRLSFEPEPGMFIDTMARFAQLDAAIDHDSFGLTLDLGHLHCLGDGNIRDHLGRWSKVLWNIHIEDMKPGVHEHLPFDEGTMDFAAIFDALHEVGYTGPLHVELPRQAHDAVETARGSFHYLRRYAAV